jgi:hypothetical protein
LSADRPRNVCDNKFLPNVELFLYVSKLINACNEENVAKKVNDD